MDEVNPSSNQTVPVIVDDLGEPTVTSYTPEPHRRQLLRCVYFAFEASEPMQHWRLGIAGHSMPFFMLGMSGIISYTLGDTPSLFLEPQDIEYTFDAIERTSLLVETGRIYLPQEFVLDALGGNVRRHDVLRMREDLFLQSFHFAQGHSSEADFAAHLGAYRSGQRPIKGGPLLQFSPLETKAFMVWSQMQLRRVSEREREWRAVGMLHREEDRSKLRF